MQQWCSRRMRIIHSPRTRDGTRSHRLEILDSCGSTIQATHSCLLFITKCIAWTTCAKYSRVHRAGKATYTRSGMLNIAWIYCFEQFCATRTLHSNPPSIMYSPTASTSQHPMATTFSIDAEIGRPFELLLRTTIGHTDTFRLNLRKIRSVSTLFDFRL